MRKRLNVLLALVTGKAIVIAQSPEEKVADVLVGKNVSKKYACLLYTSPSPRD